MALSHIIVYQEVESSVALLSFLLVTGRGKNKGQFQLPAGHSIARLWNLGKKREAGVYLGWEMFGLGNRTLCHSLCHSLSDPDLFPAFLTPPPSWGKRWSSCNSESTPSVMRLHLKKKGKKKICVWKRCLYLHNWAWTCLLDSSCTTHSSAGLTHAQMMDSSSIQHKNGPCFSMPFLCSCCCFCWRVSLVHSSFLPKPSDLNLMFYLDT